MKRYLKALAIIVVSVFILYGQANAVEVNAPAPDFSLTDTNGQVHSLSEFKGKIVVLEWFNHECPFVKKHYNSGNMQSLQKAYTDKGVVWLSINSSAADKEGYTDSAQANVLTKEKDASPTAVLLDATGTVGKLYAAKTTPHMFVINTAGVLVYQGAIDDNPSADVEDVKTAANYVKQALDETLSGKRVKIESTKSYGCSVKY